MKEDDEKTFNLKRCSELTDSESASENSKTTQNLPCFWGVMSQNITVERNDNLSDTTIQVEVPVENENSNASKANEMASVNDEDGGGNADEEIDIPFSSILLYFLLGLLGGSCGLVVILCVVCTYQENVHKKRREAFVIGLVVGTLLLTVTLGTVYLKYRSY